MNLDPSVSLDPEVQSSRSTAALIDAHCHLDDARFADDFDAMVARAHAGGVEGFVLAGVDPAGWAAQEQLACRLPHTWFTVGVHPQVAAPSTDEGLEAMLTALRLRLERLDGRRAVAIGETGLDRLPIHGPETYARQEHAFRVQLRLARKHALPVVLHVLHAHERALEILREEGLSDEAGMLHSYSGSAELVPAYAELGLSFSIAGPMTYPNARKPVLAARAIPRERLLIETDAPDQTPTPHRPGRNEPAFLVAIAHAVASARGVTFGEVAATTRENTRRLFKLA